VRPGIGQPPKRRWKILYGEHRELLDDYWNLMLQLGRLPEPEEFPQTGELREKIGSPKQALRIFIQKGGAEEVQAAAENRKRDLLVYVALANLRRRVPFGHLSLSLRADNPFREASQPRFEPPVGTARVTPTGGWSWNQPPSSPETVFML
jgi:hypothetical protein